jgi:hypothetical protein
MNDNDVGVEEKQDQINLMINANWICYKELYLKN